jgi:hypothetical protein
MTAADERIETLLVLGIGFGLYLFFKGFRTFRKYRLIEDTPATPIRSVPMGLVRVHGKASGEILLTSPVTQQPCCYYKVKIEKWTNRDRRHGWEHYQTETLGVRFYLEDPTGRIAVEATNAELDLLQSAKREVSSGPDGDIISSIARPFLPPMSPASSLDSHPGAPAGATTGAPASAQVGATDQELLSYIATTVGNPLSQLLAAGAQERLISSGPLRISFSHSNVAVPPRGAKSPEKAPIETGPLSEPRKEQLRQTMIQAARSRKGSTGFTTAMRRDAGLHASIVSAPRDAPPATEASVGGQAYNGNGLWPAQPASGKYRLTEYCILPGHYYDVMGTCTENPQPKNELDRNLIHQGQNEPTFLISWRSPQILNRSLRGRAARLVFGGGALSLVCLIMLLAKLGLF